jgi:hypothetical protein
MQTGKKKRNLNAVVLVSLAVERGTRVICRAAPSPTSTVTCLRGAHLTPRPMGTTEPTGRLRNLESGKRTHHLSRAACDR